MFEKKIASESSQVVDADLVILRRVFAQLGKDEACEFEVWQVAKSMGVAVPKNLGKYCSISDSGILRLIK